MTSGKFFLSASRKSAALPTITRLVGWARYFLRELGHCLGRHGIDRRNVFIQRIERQIVSREIGDLGNETLIRFQIARVTAGQHRLARLQFVTLDRLADQPFQLRIASGSATSAADSFLV